MELAYQILAFTREALPTLGILALGVFVILFLRRDADGQRIVFALAVRALDFLLPHRPAALARQSRRETNKLCRSLWGRKS